jgi:hypothetical protein
VFVRAQVLTPREQGDWSERSAIIWLLEHGAAVFAPIGHSPDFDLIAVLTARPSASRSRAPVAAQTGGGSSPYVRGAGTRAGTASSSVSTRPRYDYLFVAVADGRRWWVPSNLVGGGNAIMLGGPKYAAFEVDPGPPMPGAEVLDSDALRGDSGAVKRTGL